MYESFFKLKQLPFSIAPDPKFLFMSEKHKEALAHLLYGVQSSGAFVVLSGEVGSGKTTVCRCFLEQLPDNLDLAFILHPKMSEQELLASICDEFALSYPENASTKTLVDCLNVFLLKNHAEGRNSLVIIEEAQNLSEDVLEQLRLLTNLETNEKKLLQIVLLAQPELLETLKQDNMRQLAQRITARFNLQALNEKEVSQYIQHRLSVAGANFDPFPAHIKKKIFRLSGGTPRLINLICDRCLLGAYAKNQHNVDNFVLKQAWQELSGYQSNTASRQWILLSLGFIVFALVIYFAIQPADRNLKTFTNNGKINEQFDENHNLILSNTFASAARSLAELWDFDDISIQSIYGPNSFCDEVSSNGFHCYQDKASLGLILKLGSPAILKLVSKSGEEYYGVLLAEKGTDYLLRFSQEDVLVSHELLQKQWLGDFSMIISLPEQWQGRVLSVGETGELASWLETQLIELNMLDENTILTGEYHEEYEPLVKQLQSKAGIYSDGKVGIKTILYINNLLTTNIPKLNQQ